MGAEKIQIILEGINQVSAPLRQIQEQAAAVGKNIRGSLGSAFESITQNSRLANVAFAAINQSTDKLRASLAPINGILDKVRQGVRQAGLELSNAVAIGTLKFTELQRVVKDTFNQKFGGTAFRISSAINAETAKVQETLTKLKFRLQNAIDGNPIASAIQKDIQSLLPKLPTLFNKIADGVKAQSGSLAKTVGTAFQAIRDRVSQPSQSAPPAKPTGATDNGRSPTGNPIRDAKGLIPKLGALGDSLSESLFGDVIGLIPQLGAVGLAFNAIGLAAGAAQQAGSLFYDKLLKSNVELQEQLLSTKATLVATNQVISGGELVKDSTKAIQALGAPVQAAVDRIRQGSLELVGVTSGQLIPIFQNIAGQSAQIGASLTESADLTLSFAAALGTLNIPLDQQRQEVSSILQAQITSDSTLAKSLNITNDQVNAYKAQGNLVEKLTEKLSAFRAGNALAAQTINGVTSNIQELFDEITRKAGEPFIQPIVDGLNEVYKFINTNRDAIQSFISTAAEATFTFAESIISVGKTIVETIGTDNLASFASAIQSTFVLGASVVEGFAITLENLRANGSFKILETMADLAGLAAKGLALLPEGFGEISGATEASNNAIATAQELVGGLSTKSLQLQGSLKKLSDQEKLGVPLTEEQKKERQKLTAAIGIQTAALDDEIARLKEIPPQNEAQKNSIASVVAELERQKVALNDVRLAAKPVESKGTILGQMQKQAAELEAKLKAGVGDPALYDQAAEGLTKVVGQLQEAGAISPEAAAKQLQSIVANEKLGLEIRQSAQTQLYKTLEALDKDRQEELKLQQEEIAAQVEAGELSGAEAAKKTGELKQQALTSELETAKAVHDQKIALINQEIEAEKQKLKVKIDAAKAELDSAVANGDEIQVKQARDAYNALLKQQADFDQKANSQKEEADRQFNNKERSIDLQRKKTKIETEKSITAEQIKEMERRQGKISDAIAQAEVNANIETQKRVNSGAIDANDAEVEKLRSTQTRVTAEINLEKQKTAELEKLPKSNNPEENEAREQKIRASKLKTSQLVLQQLKNELDLQRKIFDAALGKIERKQAKTDDNIAQKAADAELKIQQQLNQGKIDAAKADELRGKAATDRIQSELNAERDKLEQLKALPQINTPEDIEKRENLIRDSKRRTTELQTQLLKQQAENEKKAADEAIARLEKQQEKARAVLEQAQVDREIQLQRLVNSGSLSSEQVEAEKLKLTQKRIAAELEAEKNKIKALEALPKANSKEEAERREKLVRDAKLKTSKLVLEQLQTEKQAQDAIAKAIVEKIEKNLARIKNEYTAQNQLLEEQQRLQEGLSKILEQQSNILRARQDLQESLSSATQSQYGLAVRLLEGQFAEEDRLEQQQEAKRNARKALREAKTPEERKAARKALQDIEKQEAREAQLRALKIEAKEAEIEQLEQKFILEEQSLDLEEQKQLLLEKQEQTRLRIMAIEAESNKADALANLAKVEADKSSSPEAKRAAQLQVQAADAKVKGVAEQQEIAKQQAGFTETAFDIRRQVLRQQQGVALSTAETDLAQLTPGTGDDDETRRRVLNYARVDRSIAANNGGKLGAAAEAKQKEAEKLATKFQPSATQAPAVPASQQAAAFSLASIEQQNKTNAELTGAVNEIKSFLVTKGANLGTTIQNEIHGVSDPKEAARLAAKQVSEKLQNGFSGAVKTLANRK